MAAMVLTHRWLGSEAFHRNYHVTISQPFTGVQADGSEPEWNPEWRHRPTVVHFLHRRSGLRYRATVNGAELPGAHPDPYLVYEKILMDWAVPYIEVDGPVLGESSRTDSLQPHDVARDDFNLTKSAASGEVAMIAAERERALILWGYDGLGTLVRLPLEVRAKIYELIFFHLFEQRSWQCYHTKKAGLTLMGNTHSSPLPVICRLSTAIRKEVFDSVYREQASQIIVGTELIVSNFPLQEVKAAHSKVYPSKELFIGIQVPTSRTIEAAAAVRSNVERVVKLLNGIAVNQPLPPVRASFHTNAETRGRP